jgi:phosphopentomutase
MWQTAVAKAWVQLPAQTVTGTIELLGLKIKLEFKNFVDHPTPRLIEICRTVSDLRHVKRQSNKYDIQFIRF